MMLLSRVEVRSHIGKHRRRQKQADQQKHEDAGNQLAHTEPSFQVLPVIFRRVHLYYSKQKSFCQSGFLRSRALTIPEEYDKIADGRRQKRRCQAVFCPVYAIASSVCGIATAGCRISKADWWPATRFFAMIGP